MIHGFSYIVIAFEELMKNSLYVIGCSEYRKLAVNIPWII